MRTVTLELNFKATEEMHWSVKSEVLIENDHNPEQAGHDAAQFLWRFQAGMIQGFDSIKSS